ncbi:DNA helicase II [Acidovorax sp. Leaf76]|uniref:DEAD/DEAH box helicase n=1 Tax=unclassified Acidovorax TaxID=2684926 RepID=UPI0006F61816|nr:MULTISPECIES: nuclease-related domain-containing DEAD/DEAH box helicase [unclassified Acidovorax]KQO26857.1 DNA helicase II [Acidovorax sp. Leaf76]KQO40625.1 DNA helicase II [Acidovorax sp. Leaf84]KQS42770.1 DNA helicase II [Acidovorax sp. Leaf191]
MATLIPAIGSSAFDSTGERRLAERLEQKLDDDYLLWHNVPIGPRQTYPDFVVLHPRRGLLVLETKDWHLETIRNTTRQYWEILDSNGQTKPVKNPLEQARHCAIQVVNALERDAPLVQPSGPHQGKLAFPWGHGVVFTRITRKQFDAAGLGETIASHYVICKDEMEESADPEAFQERLWNMFAHRFGGALSLPQLDRVRWIMFPQVRVQTQGALFDDNDAEAQLPDIMRVMDIQQEQLARSLGDGHRVIHGVAGSGKTMILGYRAEYLAKASTPASKPILVLCFNEPLGVKLASMMEAKGLSDRVHVRHFHSWCHRQLTTYGQALPPQGGGFYEGLVDHVIRAVERSQIPGGQYQAVMIDEGHDFAPEWLKLITQMVDPATNSLLVLYDDAQSIYERARSKQFSFKSVGIQAQGRTTILKINYRNTRQILHTASLVAADLLTADDQDDDGIPLLKPVSCGREGQAPVIIKLPTLRDEAFAIADHLASAHKEGFAWGDMAVLCADWKTMDLCAIALAQRKLPHRVRKKSGEYKPGADAIQVMTMKVSKGLEFPLVALPGVGHMPVAGEDEKDAARVFYVAATRATHRLVITASGDSGFESRLFNQR